MFNEFEIKKIIDRHLKELKEFKELKNKSEEQDEKILKLRKRISTVEKKVLGFSLDTGDNEEER